MWPVTGSGRGSIKDKRKVKESKCWSLCFIFWACCWFNQSETLARRRSWCFIFFLTKRKKKNYLCVLHFDLRLVPKNISSWVDKEPLCLDPGSLRSAVGAARSPTVAAMAPPLMIQGWGEEVGRGGGGGGGGDQDVSLWRTASRQTTSLPVMCPFGRFPANRGSRRLLASSCSTPGLTGAIWNRRGSLRHLRAPPRTSRETSAN